MPRAETGGTSIVAQIRPRGAWSSAREYFANDWVSHTVMGQLRAYIAPEDIPAGDPAPGATNSEWAEFVSMLVTGPQGIQGNVGQSGNSKTLIYRRAASTPSLPTGGSWNGTTFVLPTGWASSDPNPASTDILYACDTTLNSASNTVIYNFVFQSQGHQGTQGIQGIPGANAPDPIYQYSTDGTNYTPTPSTTEATVRMRVSVDGGTTYATWELPEGPPGVGASDDIITVYTRSESEPASANGTLSGNTLASYTPATNWTEAIPTGTDPLWGQPIRLVYSTGTATLFHKAFTQSVHTPQTA